MASQDHCAHCGDNCADDYRGPNAMPQLEHGDDTGVYWRPGACPFCRLANQRADALAKIEAERERVSPDGLHYPSLDAYVDGLDFAAEALADKDAPREYLPDWFGDPGYAT